MRSVHISHSSQLACTTILASCKSTPLLGTTLTTTLQVRSSHPELSLIHLLIPCYRLTGILTTGTTSINFQLNNIPIADGVDGGPRVLQGGNLLAVSYGNRNNFVMLGTNLISGVLNGPHSPVAKGATSTSLRDSTGWFARSQHQYEKSGIGALVDVKNFGAMGDEDSDDRV